MTNQEKQSVRQRIGSFFKDVVTLDVLTLTGNIDLINEIGSYDEDSRAFNWDDLFAELLSSSAAT